MEEMTLREKVDKLTSLLDESPRDSKKKIKIPRKAKVNKNRMKKGYVGVIKIDENGTISGEKQKVIGSTIRLNSKTYHAFDQNQVLMWEGKYPIILQPSWTDSPLVVNKDENEINETSGQDYIMARMLGDTIKVKAQQMKPLILIIGLAIGGYLLYSVLSGGI